MRKLSVLVACLMLVAAACGDSGTDDGTTTVPGEVQDSEPGDTAPEDTAPEETTPAEPVPETTTTSEAPPAPLNVVGLVPLSGVHLDFGGQAVVDQTLVWSVFSGSGGVIVENIGAPIPPGCHGTSFFDPATFALLQIGGEDAHGYASAGDDGCVNMQEDVAAGVVDGDAVRVNNEDIIVFDFGGLPPSPFDVSTQVLNPDGQDGIYLRPDSAVSVFVNDLSDATHVVGVSGLFVIDPDTGLLRTVEQPAPVPGEGCAELRLCLHDRFEIEIINAEGSPGSVLVSDARGGLFFFSSPESWEALVTVVNGCSLNDSFWVFAAGATDVEFDLTVTDTASGDTWEYSNPLGEPAPITDTSAFATCP